MSSILEACAMLLALAAGLSTITQFNEAVAATTAEMGQ